MGETGGLHKNEGKGDNRDTSNHSDEEEYDDDRITKGTHYLIKRLDGTWRKWETVVFGGRPFRLALLVGLAGNLCSNFMLYSDILYCILDAADVIEVRFNENICQQEYYVHYEGRKLNTRIKMLLVHSFMNSEEQMFGKG